MNLHGDKEFFLEVLTTVAEDKGIPEEYIEKDYYVSLLLKHIVAEVPDIVFKGGTSLSKCYGVINRFSEDIDINLKVDERATNRDRANLKSGIIRAIENVQMELTNADNIHTRRDFNKYEVSYSPSVEIGGVLRAHLLVETYLHLKSFPFERKMVNSYISNYFQENRELDLIRKYDLEPFEVNVQTLDRTFIDKLFAVCDYHERSQYTQNSRHFYDLHKILENRDFEGTEFLQLFYSVAKERSNSSFNTSSQTGYRIKEKLKEIIERGFFQEDYVSNTHYLLFDGTDYETVKNNLLIFLEADLLPEVIE